jgi:hypothetical protein
VKHPKAGEFCKVFAVGVTPGVPIPLSKDKQQTCNFVRSFFNSYIGNTASFVDFQYHLLGDHIPYSRLRFGTEAQFSFWNLAVASLATGSTVGRILDRRHGDDDDARTVFER